MIDITLILLAICCSLTGFVCLDEQPSMAFSLTGISHVLLFLVIENQVVSLSLLISSLVMIFTAIQIKKGGDA